MLDVRTAEDRYRAAASGSATQARLAVAPAALPAHVTPASSSTGSTRAPRSDREVFRVTDSMVILTALFAALLYGNGLEVDGVQGFLTMPVPMETLLLVAALIVLWQAILSVCGLYERQRGADRQMEAVAVAVACTAAAVVAGLMSARTGAALSTAAVFWAAALPGVLLTRAGTRALLRGVRRSLRTRQVIIVGSGPRAYAAFRSMRDAPDAAYEVLGFIDSNRNIERPEIRERHLGEFADLESILMHRNIDLVLIALPTKSSYDLIQEAIRVCERVGVESRYMADIFTGRVARHMYDSVGTLPTVAMKVVQDDVRLIIKRLLDLTVAAVGLLLLLPLMAAIGAAIRLSSPGPVFFAQNRYGLNRRIFKMYKFRTMVPNAEALQYSVEHLNEAGGPVFKIRADPRITKLGRFLRRTSLDELPQLFNVLKGDMSLVGPRPLPLRDVQHFSEASLMRRFSVLPGITGLWQISGRSDLGFAEWITLDLRYIDQWSLWLDLKILLRTLPAVLRGTGAS